MASKRNLLTLDGNENVSEGNNARRMIITDVLTRLTNVQNHLKDTSHECDEPCQGVGKIQWCISKLNEIDLARKTKRNHTETFDNILVTCLNEFGEGDEANTAVATHLNTRFRANSFLNTRRGSLLKKMSNRELGRFPDDTKDEQGVINFLSFESEDVSLDWLMDNVDLWTCDIFQVSDATTMPLTCVTYTLLKKRNLFDALNIPSVLLVKYIYEIERSYHSENPYHNNLHAADVTQTMHFLLSAEPLKTIFTDLEIFALIFAAAIHDVDHPGFNNPYLVKSRHRRAILYNDTHVNENHHLAVAFKLLYRDRENNFLTSLSDEDADVFRQMVIEMVLSTDMVLHIAVTSNFQVCVEKSFTKQPYSPDYNERLEIMKGLIHFADISNPTKPLELYQKWASRVTAEFFRQGDFERERGIAISPLCDRYTCDLGKSQTGFCDFIVRPLMNIVNNFYKSGDSQSKHVAETLQNHLEENFIYFKSIIQNNEAETTRKESS